MKKIIKQSMKTFKSFIFFVAILFFINQNAYSQSGDLDMDGVIDSEDVCPNLPGPKSNNGCPLQNTTNNINVTDTIELFNTTAVSITDFVDVKNTDTYYEALKSLTEKWGFMSAFADHTFTGAQPLTRIQFLVTLERCFGVLKNLYVDDNSEQIQFCQSYSAFKNLSNDINTLKDIKSDFAYSQELQMIQEYYQVLIADEDNYLRPNKEIMEADLFNALSGIFALNYNTNFSQTTVISRGDFVEAINKILLLKERELPALKANIMQEKKLAIKNFTSLGKAKVLDENATLSGSSAYNGVSTDICLDLEKADANLESLVKHFGVQEDADKPISNNDVVDILYEFEGNCNNGKLIVVRKGTMLDVYYEKGIKRL